MLEALQNRIEALVDGLSMEARLREEAVARLTLQCQQLRENGLADSEAVKSEYRGRPRRQLSRGTSGSPTVTPRAQSTVAPSMRPQLLEAFSTSQPSNDSTGAAMDSSPRRRQVHVPVEQVSTASVAATSLASVTSQSGGSAPQQRHLTRRSPSPLRPALEPSAALQQRPAFPLLDVSTGVAGPPSRAFGGANNSVASPPAAVRNPLPMAPPAVPVMMVLGPGPFGVACSSPPSALRPAAATPRASSPPSDSGRCKLDATRPSIVRSASPGGSSFIDGVPLECEVVRWSPVISARRALR